MVKYIIESDRTTKISTLDLYISAIIFLIEVSTIRVRTPYTIIMCNIIYDTPIYFDQKIFEYF